MTEMVKISPRISVQADVAERIKIGRLRPTMEDMASSLRKKVRYRTKADGKREPYIPFNSNDRGKMTRECAAVWDNMRPFAKADTERHARLQSTVPRVALRDEAGSVQYIGPDKAAEAAQRNGWHSAHRIVGVLATAVNGDFCRRCDRLKAWCECDV